MALVKRLVRACFSLFGYRISRTSAFYSASAFDVFTTLFDLRSEPVIFDVGAHVGQSAKIYKKLTPGAKIYSFEPFPESYAILKTLNFDNFFPQPFGLADITGTRQFLVNTETATNSILPFRENASDKWGGRNDLSSKEEIVCRFSTIDEFMANERIERVDFLKIDVQGAEYKVLAGANSALRSKKIRFIQFEVLTVDVYEDQQSVSSYFDLLEGFDYELVMVTDIKLVKGTVKQFDLIYKCRN